MFGPWGRRIEFVDYFLASAGFNEFGFCMAQSDCAAEQANGLAETRRRFGVEE